MSNERVIVVGAGGIAGAWLPHVVSEGLDVVAVVDLKRENAERRIDEFKLSGARAMSDLHEALAERRADFLIDLTIPEAHAKVTCAAMEAGLHVVGEKPMAANLDDARRMVETSRRTGKMYMVSQSRRWDANHESIRQTIASGRLGRITEMHCDFFIGAHFGGFRDAMESPLILDMAIHQFDLARMFLGGDAESVWCEEFNPSGSWYAGDASAMAVFRMADGVRFGFRGSWCAEGCHTSWNGNWRIIGTAGTLVYAQDESPRGEVVGDRSQAKFNLPLRSLDVEIAEVKKPGMHGGLDEMLRFLRTGKIPQTECAKNFNSLAMVHAAMRSHRDAARVEIERL